MNIEEIREYCLSKTHCFDCFPFDDDALVFKAGDDKHNKMFALVLLSRPDFVALKCDPARAIELREQHSEIEPAYHFNKKHWNSVGLNGDLTDDLIKELIDHSYDLMVASLPKAVREMF